MNTIALDLGFIKIYWYSILIVIAFIVGIILLYREAKKFNVPENFITNLLIGLIPIVLIGARLYFCLFHFDYYSQNLLEVFRVWEGGLAIHGGIIAGLIWIILYSRIYKINSLLILDFIVVSLIIGQAIGRWGNFINMEAYGPLTTYEQLKILLTPDFIIKGMYIDGTYHIPTFLYESLWCFLGFIVLLIIRNLKYIKIGIVTSAYLIWYGVARFLIEGLRTDSLMLGSIKIAQIVSLLMIVVGIIMTIIISRKKGFKNLYKERGGAIVVWRNYYW